MNRHRTIKTCMYGSSRTRTSNAYCSTNDPPTIKQTPISNAFRGLTSSRGTGCVGCPLQIFQVAYPGNKKIDKKMTRKRLEF